MATKSTTNNLLNRFAQLFRDSGNAESDSTYASRSGAMSAADLSLKQLLKAKRHDDSIRAMELSRLRRLIRARTNSEYTAVVDPSLPPPSNLGQRKRANRKPSESILDKIDGAEAHLNQWWGNATTPTPLQEYNRAEATPPVPDAAPVPSAAPAQAAMFQPTAIPEPIVVAPAAPPDFDADFDLDFTNMLAASRPMALASDTPDSVTGPVPVSAEPLELSAEETCLRDAALHYAEGEFEAAEGMLSQQLQAPDVNPAFAELLTFALFDVYRCTGQHAPFDALALDYAKRFGRSPGEWFSVPELTAPAQATAVRTAQEPAPTGHWQCPSTLTTAALDDCLLNNPHNSRICRINWESLQSIDADALPALARQLTQWCHQPLELDWPGLDQLMQVLQAGKLPMGAPAQPLCWLMQLDLLCMQGHTQAFEELALDYCVQFELSPPSWYAAGSILTHAHAPAYSQGFAATQVSRSFTTSTYTGAYYTRCELRGNVLGDDAQGLHNLRNMAGQNSQIVVSCALLGRVDFTAASALLNWVVECASKECEVQFIHLPRLVQVFFGLLGMDQFASLSSGAR